MFDVITIGSSTRDVFLRSTHFVEVKDEKFEGGKAECFPLGAKVEVEEIAFATGGGGTNAAVTFARQGFHTACVGVIGKDSAGEAIIEDLTVEGVDTTLIQHHDDGHTAFSAILVHKSGSRTILSYRGEGQHFDVNTIPFNKFNAKWIYIDSLGGHTEIFDKIVEHALANDIKLAMNPGSKTLVKGLAALENGMKSVDVFITNKEEGAGLTGADDSDWEGVARSLKEKVKGIVSVSDGKNGVLVIGEDGKKYQAGVPDSPVIERTGAGDSFGAGFVSEYIRSNDIAKAIQLATANASSVVTKYGGKEGILKKGDMGPWLLVEVSVE